MTFSRIYETAGVRRLPVSPIEVARALGIKVINYTDAARIFETSRGELYLRCPLGFSFKENGRCCIAMNENACGEQRRRFTAAHELAHCILGHLGKGGLPREQELAAERFAAELLAPLVVLRECRVGSAREIARLCGISRQAGAVRISEIAERERLGFCPTEDERLTAELFREFTESYSSLPKKSYRENLYISIY